MRLLVVQILDAVFDAAQEGVGLGQFVGNLGRHQAGTTDALQRLQRGARAQLGKLATAHHLQQLHGEFDLADATTRELHIIGALGPAGTALGRMVADLAVQHAQRFEHVVVKVAAEHEGQHHVAQRLAGTILDAGARRHAAAFHPGKALPFAALHHQVLFQRVQRGHGGAGVAVGPQGQIDTEHKAVLGGFAHQRVDDLDRAREVFVEAGPAGTAGLAVRAGAAAGFTIAFVDVDQVDVAGDVQFARTQLAHAHDPQIAARAIGLERGTEAGIELFEGLVAGDVERHFGQPGHAERDARHGLAAIAVEHGQTLHHELAQHAQRAAYVQPAFAQGLVAGAHGLAVGQAGSQQRQFLLVAAMQPLHKAGMQRTPGGNRVHHVWTACSSR